MIYQTTIYQEVRAAGVGLHSGNVIDLVLKPAPPSTGIVFVRTDLDGASVTASLDNIDFAALQLATTLRKDEVVVQTTEHLLSALYAMGITNVFVEINGAEVPIMDGSSAPFLVLLEEAGIKQQAVAAKTLKVTRPFSFQVGDKKITAQPCRSFKVSYDIEFDHPLIRQQQKTVDVGQGSYESEIAPARTFGFLKDVNYLKSRGLARGGSLDNAVVLDGDRILNESLRLKDEFVSHKILDLIGDFAMCGARIEGHFTAHKAGHEVHARFMEALLASDCFAWETAEQTAGEVVAGQTAGPLASVA